MFLVLDSNPPNLRTPNSPNLRTPNPTNPQPSPTLQPPNSTFQNAVVPNRKVVHQETEESATLYVHTTSSTNAKQRQRNKYVNILLTTEVHQPPTGLQLER